MNKAHTMHYSGSSNICRFLWIAARAARQAIADLEAGRMPPAPPSIDNYETVVTGKRFLLSDMKSNKNSTEGIGGVHCAIGPANQPGSTLLFHWLHPAEGSPFKDMMKERGSVTFVPVNHIVQVKDEIIPSEMFYSVINSAQRHHIQ